LPVVAIQSQACGAAQSKGRCSVESFTIGLIWAVVAAAWVCR
jgi:hypothetical protein